MSVKTQLSVYTVRERLSEATIPKGIVGGFKFTVQRMAREAMDECLQVI